MAEVDVAIMLLQEVIQVTQDLLELAPEVYNACTRAHTLS